jgi:hypothetical protein
MPIPLNTPTFFDTWPPPLCIDSESDKGSRSCSNWKPERENERPDLRVVLGTAAVPSDSSSARNEAFESSEDLKVGEEG